MTEKRTDDNRIQELLQRREAIDKQIAMAKQKQKERERAQEIRRRHLVGAMILDGARVDQAQYKALVARMDTYLVKPEERALFGLSPKQMETA